MSETDPQPEPNSELSIYGRYTRIITVLNALRRTMLEVDANADVSNLEKWIRRAEKYQKDMIPGVVPTEASVTSFLMRLEEFLQPYKLDSDIDSE